MLKEVLISNDLDFWNICLPDHCNLKKTRVPAFFQILHLKYLFTYKFVISIKCDMDLLSLFHTLLGTEHSEKTMGRHNNEYCKYF